MQSPQEHQRPMFLLRFERHCPTRKGQQMRTTMADATTSQRSLLALA